MLCAVAFRNMPFDDLTHASACLRYSPFYRCTDQREVEACVVTMVNDLAIQHEQEQQGRMGTVRATWLADTYFYRLLFARVLRERLLCDQYYFKAAHSACGYDFGERVAEAYRKAGLAIKYLNGMMTALEDKAPRVASARRAASID